MFYAKCPIVNRIGTRKVVSIIDKSCQKAIEIGAKRHDTPSMMTGIYKEVELVIKYFKKRGILADYDINVGLGDAGGYCLAIDLEFSYSGPDRLFRISYSLKVS